HGAIVPVNGQGGIAEIATLVGQVRERHGNVLVLDAGDMNAGQPISNMFGAEPDILAFNMIGYDAMTLGNHEFDRGRALLETQMAMARFPFLSANTMDGRNLLAQPYVVKNYEGFRVGVFGITTARSTVLAANSFTASLDFTDEIEAAKRMVDTLRNRERVDIVIALVHMGDRSETAEHISSVDLAAAVPGIDLVIDGHHHTLFPEPLFVENVSGASAPVVSAGDRGRWVGRADISIVDGAIVGFDWVTLPVTGLAPDPAVAAMLAPFREIADASLKEVVGQASGDFPQSRVRYEETALGNIINDGIAWWIRDELNQSVDFVFTNGGGIRAPLQSGAITREDILTVLPFENYVMIASITGARLIEMFDFVATIPLGNGAFPQFSSDVRYARGASGGITALTIGGAPIDPDRIYRFSTNDFVMRGGDGYSMMAWATEIFDTSQLVSTALIEFMSLTGGNISPALDGRVVIEL
ncbi:MAG: 5'-nucleotidase C-terminal domain-containing protein, partial [Treponema sp.]|nr:5'-nucleotidase C-terminal domain-containing protein [Treponema sp.]